MPELAEVEFYRKQWDPGIGKEILRVRSHPKARDFRDAPAANLQALKGQSLIGSVAHGKQMCFRFSGGSLLGIHLGMAGKLFSAVPEFVPAKHDHLALVTPAAALVFSDYRMFGKVLFHKGQVTCKKGQVNSGEEKYLPEWWSDLPPQPQEKAFDKPRFRRILKRHPRRPLKALLLDQQHFPGIGNWMADEILWRARVHPGDAANHLSLYQQGRVFEAIKEVAKDALRVIGTNWSDPPDDWLFNHRWRDGGRCPKSGKPLVRETIGGRTSCFSPAIQKKKR